MTYETKISVFPGVTKHYLTQCYYIFKQQENEFVLYSTETRGPRIECNLFLVAIYLHYIHHQAS
jgi:hypothetical protein